MFSVTVLICSLPVATHTQSPLTGGAQTPRISRNVVGKDDGPHAGLTRPALTHQQHLRREHGVMSGESRASAYEIRSDIDTWLRSNFLGYHLTFFFILLHFNEEDAGSKGDGDWRTKLHQPPLGHVVAPVTEWGHVQG